MKIYITVVAVVIAAVAIVVPRFAEALDMQAPQVEIEARIMSISTDHSKELGIDWAFVQRMEGGEKILEAAIVARGVGADLQNWVPIKTFIETDSGILVPYLIEVIQIPLQDSLGSLSQNLFGSIGDVYVEHALAATSSPGINLPIRVLSQAPSMPQDFDVGTTADTDTQPYSFEDESRQTLSGVKSQFKISELPPLQVFFKAQIKHRETSLIVMAATTVIIEDWGEGEDEEFRDALERVEDVYSVKKTKQVGGHIVTDTFFPQLGTGTNPAPSLPSDDSWQETDTSSCD